ncbi:hypothetical protein [Micromonospora sp. WMMD980]|uniref:hypothetical protein n=1 Tax=Micromonospora sp. WMMD980 TaxID=3016088 RepID=UPI0024173274|nr:hypothetical protein [Micromonospora sp. WMMD980]MDG4803655.1 hypothetical protein [Micromonospora sp. WMMD980]
MSQRLWFRVEDVLPLAEHALACTTHHLTRAQLMAGEHNTPALTLRRVGADGHLRSNGVPTWHTDDGDEHAAHGRAVRHVDEAPDPAEDLYLPLRHPGCDGRRPIDVLRAAAALDHHWLAIDTDTWPGAVLDTSHIEAYDHHADTLGPHARWRPAMVTAARLNARCYPALIARDHVLGEDGLLICRLHPRTVRHLTADLTAPWRAATMPGEHPLVRFYGATAVLLEDTDSGGHPRVAVDDRCHPDHDGCYPLGIDRWHWHIVPAVAMPLHDRLRLHLTTLHGRVRPRRR